MSETYERNRLCPDSDCGGIAEPEEEPQGGPGALLRYYVCCKCDMEFGYELVQNPDAPGNDGYCAMGVPEEVRRAVSVAPVPDGKVFLGTISRRPES